MSLTWSERKCWVAVFDVLGFGALIEQAAHGLTRAVLIDKLDDLLSTLDASEKEHGKLESMVFSDTIVIFSPTQNPRDYPWFLLQCKNLIKHSIIIQLPIRGAISVGEIFTAAESPIILGRPFVEAFNYCEDQDWIGLLLAPSATRALREHDLEPLHHHFVKGPIPLRKMPSDDALAYRFQDGESNFNNPLLTPLEEMQLFAPNRKDKEKYCRTIKHIQTHHHWITDSQT